MAEFHPDTSSNESSTADWVLVVDDEPGVRRVLRRLLMRMGLSVAEAESGVEAKEALTERDYAVVISDISMPGMDGMALLREVRLHDYDVPVILVTGRPSFESAITAIEYGAFHYFVKPFENEEFRTVVSRAVRMGRIARAKRSMLDLLGGAQAPGDLAGLASSFERAMDGMWIAFQPIVRADSDHGIYGYEALLRSVEASLPDPGAVIGAAERLNRLAELGRLVRRRAAEPCMACSSEVQLFVNVHPEELMDSELDDPNTPLGRIADKVILEITERASLERLGDVRERVADLREIGYRIAVDDLGAGYAGLTSLATLQPEIVKIDMSLVRGADSSPMRQRLIGSITRACQDSGILVVAEGIETSQERDAMVELGCDLLQGFYFARPGKPFPDATW